MTDYACRLCSYDASIKPAVREHIKAHHDEVIDVLIEAVSDD